MLQLSALMPDMTEERGMPNYGDGIFRLIQEPLNNPLDAGVDRRGAHVLPDAPPIEFEVNVYSHVMSQVQDPSIGVPELVMSARRTVQAESGPTEIKVESVETTVTVKTSLIVKNFLERLYAAKNDAIDIKDLSFPSRNIRIPYAQESRGLSFGSFRVWAKLKPSVSINPHPRNCHHKDAV